MRDISPRIGDNVVYNLVDLLAMFHHTKSHAVINQALILCFVFTLTQAAAKSNFRFRRDTPFGSPDDVTAFDFAPDFSKDPAPPFPSLNDAQGKPIELQNLRVSENRVSGNTTLPCITHLIFNQPTLTLSRAPDCLAGKAVVKMKSTLLPRRITTFIS
jgi:hypothetical protein